MSIKKIISRRSLQTLIAKKRRQGLKIGFVPTMGFFHEGHLSLMRRAVKECDYVVVSIFVNPLQFGNGEDFHQYPRDLTGDSRLAASVGVHALFVPRSDDMYPKGFTTTVSCGSLTEKLCGASRPGHFDGVTTVCLKLFTLVQPDIVYMGQKDAQQALIIHRMVRDLDLPLKIKRVPIVRERDGLAMSSRNSYLSADERAQAVCLYQSLCCARQMIRSGCVVSATIKRRMREVIKRYPASRIDYCALVDPDTLQPVSTLSGTVLIGVAVWIGSTRLIDNMVVKVI